MLNKLQSGVIHSNSMIKQNQGPRTVAVGVKTRARALKNVIEPVSVPMKETGVLTPRATFVLKVATSKSEKVP